jgi:hypothetical protein
MDSYYCGIKEKEVCGIDKAWQCTLCKLVIKSEQDRKEHAQESGHQTNVLKKLESDGRKHTGSYTESGMTPWMILRRNTSALTLDSRADRLPSLNWKLEIQGVLYRYTKLDMTCMADEGVSLLVQAETLLRKYEQVERLSLLELAVWKEACISCAGQEKVDSKTSMETLDHAILFVAKNRHTWKKYRTEMRKASAIDIVIQHVVPFLGKP